MTQITVDANVAAQFRLAADDAVVVDPSGNVLGKFSPEPRLPQPPYGIKSPYSVEELDQFEKEPGGGSLADFWTSMGRT